MAATAANTTSTMIGVRAAMAALADSGRPPTSAADDVRSRRAGAVSADQQ